MEIKERETAASSLVSLSQVDKYHKSYKFIFYMQISLSF